MPGNPWRRRILLLYSLSSLLLSVAILVLYFRQPSQSDRAFVLGYSWLRLALGLIPFVGAVFFLRLSVEIARDRIPPWFRSPFGESYLERSVTLSVVLLYLIGAVLVWTRIADKGGLFSDAIVRLFPLSLWLTIITSLSLLTKAVTASKAAARDASTFTLFLLLLLLGAWVQVNVLPDIPSTTDDVYYTYLEGNRLAAGQNPYARILEEEYREDGKYPIYFGGFYLLSGLSQLAGLSSYEHWIIFWRSVFLLASLMIAWLMFYTSFMARQIPLAIFAPLFWLLNRWTLHIVHISDIDFLALVFLVASLVLWRRNRWGFFLLYGLSLSIKQMAIFLLPLYMVWAWRERRRDASIGFFLGNLLLIGAFPLLSTAPFLFWSAKGVVTSIMVSLTRAPVVIGRLHSVDAYMGWSGVLAKVPMLLSLLLSYTVCIRQRLNAAASALLVMMVYAGLNAVYFPSHFIWVVPLVPLAFAGPLRGTSRTASGPGLVAGAGEARGEGG